MGGVGESASGVLVREFGDEKKGRGFAFLKLLCGEEEVLEVEDETGCELALDVACLELVESTVGSSEVELEEGAHIIGNGSNTLRGCSQLVLEIRKLGDNTIQDRQHLAILCVFGFLVVDIEVDVEVKENM